MREQTDILNGLTYHAKYAGWFIPCQNVCFASERTSFLSRNAAGLLHNEIGPSLTYPDGLSLYAIHGLRLPEYVIMQPDKITVADIESEENAEIRRVKIDKYGIGRYILDSGASEIDRDEWGILYRKELRDDEPMVLVRYQNSTPNPDGSRREYFHRVDPNLRPLLGEIDGKMKFGKPQQLTAKNAIASTFGLYGEEYNPTNQT